MLAHICFMALVVFAVDATPAKWTITIKYFEDVKCNPKSLAWTQVVPAGECLPYWRASGAYGAYRMHCPSRVVPGFSFKGIDTDWYPSLQACQDSGPATHGETWTYGDGGLDFGSSLATCNPTHPTEAPAPAVTWWVPVLGALAGALVLLAAGVACYRRRTRDASAYAAMIDQ